MRRYSFAGQILLPSHRAGPAAAANVGLHSSPSSAFQPALAAQIYSSVNFEPSIVLEIMAKDGKKRALIVVDVQEDFCEPNGSLAVTGGRGLASLWNQLLASEEYVCKIATRDSHPRDHISFASQHPGAQPFTSTHTIQNPKNADEPAFTTTLWPDHCIVGTSGHDLIPELDQQYVTHYVGKGKDKRVEEYSGFGAPFRNPSIPTDLHDILKKSNVDQVDVVGLAFDYCVKHTAIDAATLGYETYVLEDATKAVDQSEEGLQATRKELKEAGVRLVQGSNPPP